MKKIIQSLVLVSLIAIIVTGCRDNGTSGTITDPFGTGTGLGNNNTPGVTFTVRTVQGQQGGTIFTATPSVSVKITKVTISLPAQQFEDVIYGDGTTVYQGNQTVMIQEYLGVEAGQQWTLKFEGTLANNNQAFNVTTNYTVPN